MLLPATADCTEVSPSLTSTTDVAPERAVTADVATETADKAGDGRHLRLLLHGAAGRVALSPMEPD